MQVRLSHRWLTLFVITILACGLAVGTRRAWTDSAAIASTQPYPWHLPAWAPKPVVPADNPMTVAKVELGRHLFYEPRLSINGQFSCATCHVQSVAFTDGKPLAVGATGDIHPRNSMSLANIGYNSVLTWANPLMRSLEQQMLVPLFGEHPVEMGMAGREADILAMLEADSVYPQRFAAAFSEEPAPINLRNLTRAIASFERSLVSFNSPYDRYRYGGEPNAISASAKRGEALFNSERLECFHCHSGLNFSDSTVHERLAFVEIAFHNTGLYNIDGRGAYPPHNTGVYEITHDPRDMGRFKAPTLRNIALTAPYMHDGSVATLEEAIAHYAAGGRTLRTGPYAGVGRDNPLKSTFIQGFELTPSEQSDLLEFLSSLTDESLTQNPAWSAPSLH